MTNLYIFLRAHILTDESFKDLAHLTDQALEKAAASSEGDPITSQFELPPRPPKIKTENNRDDPTIFRRADSQSRGDEALRRRARDARENRGLDSPAKGGVGIPLDPPRDGNQAGGSPFEEPIARRATGAAAAPPEGSSKPRTPSPSGVIPDTWKRRGLRVNPEGNSWFLPLRLDLREKERNGN